MCTSESTCTRGLTMCGHARLDMHRGRAGRFVFVGYVRGSFCVLLTSLVYLYFCVMSSW